MPPTFDFPLSHFSLTPGLSLKSAPNHSLTVPRVSFCKILGEPGLLRRDLTALPMLRCDITDPTIISNVSVLAIQSIYLPRFLTGCVTVDGLRKAAEVGEDDDGNEEGGEEEVEGEGDEDEGGEEEEKEESEDDTEGWRACGGCWLMLTCEFDPTTLRFDVPIVMLRDFALMTTPGGLRGLPGPRRMSFSRIAAASAARARSCFVR